MKKKYLAFVLSVLMLLCSVPASALEDNPGQEWPTKAERYYTQEPLRFQPTDNYISQQNPPAFTWPIVYDSVYELVVAADPELTDIRYRVEDLDKNVYNFPCAFETGVDYYWSVRFRNAKGLSKWSEPLRFRIDEDAVDFPVVPVEQIGEMLKKERPRMLLDQELLEQIRSIDRSTEEFKTLKSTVEAIMNQPLPEKMDYITVEQLYDPSLVYFHKVSNYFLPTRDLINVAVLYLITDDSYYGDHAVRMLENLFDWDAAEVFEWTSRSDTAEAIFAYNVSLVYDWLYNRLNDTQRQKSVQLIERNLTRVFEHFGQNGNLMNSLYAYPYDSHSWRMNMAMVAALSIYEESALAKRIVEFHYPLFVALMYPFAYQDGSSSQGPFYGMANDYLDMAGIINSLGLVDLTNRSYFANNPNSLLYQWPTNWVNNVGDAYNQKPSECYQYLVSNIADAFLLKNKEDRSLSKWLLQRGNSGRTEYYYPANPLTLLYNASTDEPELPAKKPDDMYFPDTGWIGMYSNIADDNRIGMTFKSTWYGTFSHAHPDQNGFVIQGYGETLAIDSGYYDSFGSTFDTGFNRKTYAHNAITFDDGIGQQPSDLNKKGKITGFIGDNEFSLAAGDATQAYAPQLEKAKRSIIYIKPDTFIVIDDLESKGKEKTWEYWLNANGSIAFHEGKNGATVSKGEAALDVSVQYPAKVESNYIDIFAGPDLLAVTPPSMAGGSTDKRLYFQTEPLKSTKLVTTLNVRRSSEDAQYIKTHNFGSYLKLEFPKQVAAYINLTDGTVETQDGFSFDGAAFVYNPDGFILTEGSFAAVDGQTLLESDKSVSAVVRKDGISVSSLADDAALRIPVVKDVKGFWQHGKNGFRSVPELETKYGIRWEQKTEGLELSVYPGSYTLYRGEKEEPGKKGQGVLTIEIDGEKREIPFTGTYNVRGELLYDFYPADCEGLYVLQEAKGLSVKDIRKDSLLLLQSGQCLMTLEERPCLKLKAVNGKEYEASVSAEPGDVLPSVAASERAVNYASRNGDVKNVWWDRIQNYTLQYFEDLGEMVSWKLEVPESGYYDIVISGSTVSGAAPSRLFCLGGVYGKFTFPATAAYSDLDAVRLKTNIWLEKGDNKLDLIAMGGGRWILDWIGLIKSEQ